MKKAVKRGIIIIGGNFFIKEVASQMEQKLLELYLSAVNLAAFLLMGMDKRRAQRGAWRISEKSLFFPAVLGGALGGTLGMHLFRHKTRHWYFRYGFPLLLVLQVAGLTWWYGVGL